MEAWADDGSLPDNDAQLARITRLTRYNWQRSKNAVLKFWKLDEDGRLRQKRLTNEIDKIARISEVRREAAKKRPVDNPVESCGQLDCATVTKRRSPKNEKRNDINGHFQQLHTTLNPRRKKELPSAIGARGHARQQQEKSKIGTEAQTAPHRNYRQARQAWEAALARQLGPAAYAEAVGILSLDQPLCERATAAEQRKPGSGVMAALLGLQQHTRRTASRRAAP
jgi:uncharacterized protein YdaU (DUF1376 family)